MPNAPGIEALRDLYANDFAAFAEDCLQIRTKDGPLLPFTLNKAQLYVHSMLEKQRTKTGKVRAILLKGRQQGMSTYTEARFFWKVIHNPGTKAFILTHHGEATEALFEMTNRFYNTCHPLFQPSMGKQNKKELYFDTLDSGYRIGTAGTSGAGRGQTIQFFHGSEVAFWENGAEHLAASMQAVPNAANTEVILESTANGVSNVFYKVWQDAEMGKSEYLPIFVPWFWQEEYQSPTSLTPEMYEDEEEILHRKYHLTPQQMQWRRNKIQELTSPEKFKQEYPNTAQEAFITSVESVFIPPDSVTHATVKKDTEPYGARIGGCDPARFGDDRTVFLFRHGPVLQTYKAFIKIDLMETVGHAVRLIDEWNLDKLFVDTIGVGAGVYDRLRELGYSNVVTSVQSSNKAMQEKKYSNLRAEMWDKMKNWLYSADTEIPDDGTLVTDLTGLMYSFDSNGRLKLEKKEDAKKRGIRSPDIADALAMTFAYPVRSKHEQQIMMQRSPNGKDNYLASEGIDLY